MATHWLKTWPEFYQALVDGAKTFEIRRDDRGFQVGDELILEEYDPTLHQRCYTGRALARRVTYVLRGMGLQDGYVCLGLMAASGLASALREARPAATAGEVGCEASQKCLSRGPGCP